MSYTFTASPAWVQYYDGARSVHDIHTGMMVGFVTCRICGASVASDAERADQGEEPYVQHLRWHYLNNHLAADGVTQLTEMP